MPLHPNQHAYQPGKSLEMALKQLLVLVEKVLDQQDTLGVFLDIEGACNNTSYDSVCIALDRHGVDHTIVQCINTTLEGCLTAAAPNGFSRRVSVSRGVLSPLLWCRIVDDLVARLSGSGICIQATQMTSSSGGEMPKHGVRAHWVLHTLETWCDKVDLSVKLNKTELVFTRRRKLSGFLQLHFLGVTLLHSILVKYLWIALDSQLTWREHVDVKVRKAHSLMWACRRACGATWCLRPKVVH